MRLTVKNRNTYDLVGECLTNTEEFQKNIDTILDKLGQLEDIEDELGIDLITYFKIKSAEKVYIKELGHDISEMLVRNSKDGVYVCYKGFANIPECDSYLQFTNYGKTWALTKEELNEQRSV